MQVPLRLGVLGCSLVADQLYKAGPWLVMAYAMTVVQLLGPLGRLCQSEPKGSVLVAPAQQQLIDSGLVTCLQTLAEAAATQLERCTAAAAAVPADDNAALAAAAAVAAAGVNDARTGSESSRFMAAPARCLEALQVGTGSVLEALIVLYGFFPRVQDIVSKTGGTPAAGAHLGVVAMRHISVVLQQLQQQRKEPSNGPVTLAYGVIDSTYMISNVTGSDFQERSYMALLNMGPDFVVWSDMTFLLVTYANIFQRQRQLPMNGMESSSTASSSSSSSSSKQQRRPATSLPKAGGRGFADGVAAWKQVKGQWDRLPASHQQLLQLLGVSPQAVVWLAALNQRRAAPCYPPSAYWYFNAHNVAIEFGPELKAPLGVANAASASEQLQNMQQMMQQWASRPLSELLQPLLLYAAAHAAAPSGEEFICCCAEAFLFVYSFLDAQNGSVQPHGGQSARFRSRPGLTPTVRDELLLLTVQLLQRLQQQRGAASSTSSQPPASAAAPAVREPGRRSFATAAELAQCLDRAEATGIEVLLFLAEDLRGCRRVQSAAGGPAAAATILTDVGMRSSLAVLPVGDGSSTSDGAASAPSRTADGADATAEAAATIPAALFQKSGALFGVVEGFLRAQGTADMHSMKAAVEWMSLCCPDGDGQAALLLQLALGGTAEQQVAFFNLMVTLLKLAAMPKFSGTEDLGSHSRIIVAQDALMMLSVLHDGESHVAGAAAGAAASKSGAPSSRSVAQGTSSTVMTGALWLLLLGRCFMHWGAELAQMQSARANWALLVRQAQQQQRQQASAVGSDAVLTTVLTQCFAHSQPFPLMIARKVLSALGDSSSIGEGLAAAGYDIGPVLQAFEDVAACYPGVVQTEGPGDLAGSFAALVKASQAVGRACSVFAVSHCCNNPVCSNMAGASEAAIISGKGCICSGCEVARYCGKGCQTAHWKQHKPVCKMLSAATGDPKQRR